MYVHVCIYLLLASRKAYIITVDVLSHD